MTHIGTVDVSAIRFLVLTCALVRIDEQLGIRRNLNMKMAPDEVDLPHYEHMNRAQRRAFLLRDQLKYEEDSHLDAFIAGICSPEPPQYRRTSSGIQPPYKEVTIKQNTTRFDLGNVEFEDKSVRRVYLACVEDSFEMHELKPLSEDEDAFNAVPINYHVAQHIMPVYQKKYEAIYARVQRINAMRKHLYEHVRTGPPHTSTRFKEGQVSDPSKLCNLNRSTADMLISLWRSL